MNLRVPFPQDIHQNLSWNERKESVASAILSYKPHILAVQEDCYFMNIYLRTKLSGVYTRYGLFNRNGDSHPTAYWPDNAFSSAVGKDGEHNSVWYDTQRFESINNTTFWLSDTPNVAGTSFDEITGRIVNCVLLQERVSGGSRMLGRIFFCSTHLPSGNVTKQLLSVDVLSRMFLQYQEEDDDEELTMMISGDFNSIPGSKTYQAMIQAGFIDTRQVSNENKPIEDYSYTTNDWSGSKNSLIDYVWIYQKPKEELRKSRLNNTVMSVMHLPIPCCSYPYTVNNKTASDHLMVVVDFDITYLHINYLHLYLY